MRSPTRPNNSRIRQNSCVRNSFYTLHSQAGATKVFPLTLQYQKIYGGAKLRRKNDIPQPQRHGVIRVSSMKQSHAKKHLQIISKSAAEVRDYGGHESTADSRGDFAPGGAAGEAYETTSVNDTPDPDWSGDSR